MHVDLLLFIYTQLHSWYCISLLLNLVFFIAQQNDVFRENFLDPTVIKKRVGVSSIVYWKIDIVRPCSCSSSSSDPSSSSEDSDAGSDGLGVGKGVKRFTKTRTNLGLKVRTPDQLTRGWQYRLLISVDQSAWMEDDSSLRVEALKGIKTSYATVVDTRHRQIWQILTNKY